MIFSTTRRSWARQPDSRQKRGAGTVDHARSSRGRCGGWPGASRASDPWDQRGAIPLLEPDRLTCRVQSKDLPTGLVVGHSGTVIVAEAAEAVGLGGDDRGRYARTDARLAPDQREPLAASVAAVKEPTGVLAKLAAVEAEDVEGCRGS
jgi:hypothetical protein